jgi:AcrR family transcriptional regulator
VSTSAQQVLKKEDGRTLRSATTRRAVAEAYLNLVDGGDMRPTARAIAAEAGVSERAVFRHFQDMETLHSEAAVLQIQRVSRDVPPPAPTTGPVEERAALLARRWCTLHERVTPVRRVALLHEPFSTEIARRLAWIRGA